MFNNRRLSVNAPIWVPTPPSRYTEEEENEIKTMNFGQLIDQTNNLDDKILAETMAGIIKNINQLLDD